MYMSFSPPLKVFLFSILVGGFFGIIWDINRVLKTKNKNKRMTFILDISFFIISCISTLIFFYIFTYAGFRGFIVVGEILGFILYICTIEKPIYKALLIIIKFLYKIFSTVFKIIKKFVLFIYKILSKIFKIIFKPFKKIFKKIKKNTCFYRSNKCIIKKLINFIKNANLFKE